MEMKIRSYRKTDEKIIIQLWEECGLTVPWNNPQLDIDRKLRENSEEFLVGQIDDEIMATAIVGFDGHRGWVYYLGVKPKYRSEGFGNQMMKVAEKHLINIGCPKINIMVRESNSKVINFYEAIGYEKQNIVTLGKRLIPDN